jgi:sulfur transfer protein SufE
MEKKAAEILFIPQDSNFFVNGKRMKDISKARPNGMRRILARIKTANRAITVAIAKNSF